jgi:inosine-uridine nucleoside N-ribohydrolase
VFPIINVLQIPVYIGAHEALALKLERPAGAILHHGANGFGDVIFDQPALDHPDRPVIQDEHAVVAINRLVNENPG